MLQQPSYLALMKLYYSWHLIFKLSSSSLPTLFMFRVFNLLKNFNHWPSPFLFLGKVFLLSFLNPNIARIQWMLLLFLHTTARVQLGFLLFLLPQPQADAFSCWTTQFHCWQKQIWIQHCASPYIQDYQPQIGIHGGLTSLPYNHRKPIFPPYNGWSISLWLESMQSPLRLFPK